MTRYAALLRGINVGGNRIIRMADLREVFVTAGCDDVQTYVQSGNVVFGAAAGAAELRPLLEAAILRAVGFDVPVILRTREQLATIVARNPYPGVDPARHLVAFLSGAPAAGAAGRIDQAAFAPEEFVLLGDEVHLHLPDGIGRAKLPQALSVLATPWTGRNWRTVEKLLGLAGG